MQNANSAIMQKGPNGKFSAIGFSHAVMKFNMNNAYRMIIC